MDSSQSMPKKSLGQHWLNDVETLDYICKLANLDSADHVLEIGPGKGSLTSRLLQAKAQVIAVEIDDSLASDLQKLSGDNLQIINQDILKFDLTSLRPNYKVVANIPYYLTSNLVRILSESVNPPKQITLLVQEEVAQRICANPGEMSILSVSAQLYYECMLGKIVKSEMFIPPPKVDSQVVQLTRKVSQKNKLIDTKNFFKIVKAGFSSRRKTLLNSLSGGLNMSKDSTSEVLLAAKIDPTQRPQELSIEQWLKLSKLLTSSKL